MIKIKIKGKVNLKTEDPELAKKVLDHLAGTTPLPNPTHDPLNTMDLLGALSNGIAEGQKEKKNSDDIVNDKYNILPAKKPVNKRKAMWNKDKDVLMAKAIRDGMRPKDIARLKELQEHSAGAITNRISSFKNRDIERLSIDTIKTIDKYLFPGQNLPIPDKKSPGQEGTWTEADNIFILESLKNGMRAVDIAKNKTLLERHKPQNIASYVSVLKRRAEGRASIEALELADKILGKNNEFMPREVQPVNRDDLKKDDHKGETYQAGPISDNDTSEEDKIE